MANVLDDARAVKAGKLKPEDVPERRRKTVVQLSEVIDETYEPVKDGDTRYKKHNRLSQGSRVHNVKSS